MKADDSTPCPATQINHGFLGRTLLFCAVVTFSLAARDSALAETYIFTALGGQPYALNNSGQVAGSLGVGNCKSRIKRCRSCSTLGCYWYYCVTTSGHCESHAFLWTPTALNGTSGDLLDLGTLHGSDDLCYASSINQGGEVVGRSGANGFLYSSGRMTDLGVLDPESINTAGKIIGHGTDGYAFLFQDGTVTNLGALPQNSSSRAIAINDLDQIVGWSSALNDTVSHAVLWHNGAIKDLGTLAGYTHSEALALNTNRQIVGSCYNYPGSSRACLFTIDDFGNVIARTSLGTLPRFTNSTAVGINNRGEIVGNCWNDDEPAHAYLWDRPNGMRDLGEAWASAINDAGQILVANGLLSPVPNPRLSSPLRQPNGQFRFTLIGQAGSSYTIQASTNLVNWIAVTNFVSATGTNQFTDAAAPNFNRRFYRAVTP